MRKFHTGQVIKHGENPDGHCKVRIDSVSENAYVCTLLWENFVDDEGIMGADRNQSNVSLISMFINRDWVPDLDGLERILEKL